MFKTTHINPLGRTTILNGYPKDYIASTITNRTFNQVRVKTFTWWCY